MTRRSRSVCEHCDFYRNDAEVDINGNWIYACMNISRIIMEIDNDAIPPDCKYKLEHAVADNT